MLKPAPYVLQGLFEVFEMHLVHTYATFADVPLAALLGEAPMPEQVRSESRIEILGSRTT